MSDASPSLKTLDDGWSGESATSVMCAFCAPPLAPVSPIFDWAALPTSITLF